MDEEMRTMKPATLPTLPEYLTTHVPAEHCREVWAWAGSLPRYTRHRARVLDLHFPPGPVGDMVDIWEPVAEHPKWAIWLVKRAWP